MSSAASSRSAVRQSQMEHRAAAEEARVEAAAVLQLQGKAAHFLSV